MPQRLHKVQTSDFYFKRDIGSHPFGTSNPLMNSIYKAFTIFIHIIYLSFQRAPSGDFQTLTQVLDQLFPHWYFFGEKI